MESYFGKAKKIASTAGFRKTIKIIGIFLIALLAFVGFSGIGLHFYFERNQKEIVEKINQQINENIQGEAKIGDIGYKFLVGFPNFTVVLSDVQLEDSLIAIHKRPLLKAKEIEVRLNVLSFLKNEVNVHKIVIIDATIDLFKDKNGISNSNIFKPKKKKSESKSSTSTSIDEVLLRNVNFISENQKGNKLFSFQIESLRSKINHSGYDWTTEVKLRTIVKSLAFNTKLGSFVQNKLIQGKLAVHFLDEKDLIVINTNNLEIGKERFDIKAHFNLGEKNSLFDIDINTKILWKNASNLLSNNITSKLNQFDLQIPLQASCLIKGDMNAEGDPEIIVNATIKNDVLTTSYGAVSNCSFQGKFTNNFQNGLGFNDANSAIIITNFKGEYQEIPIDIPSGIINNLEQPVASGKINSNFDVVKMKNIIDADFIHFTEGMARVNLNFKVDIVDLKLNKPRFTGKILVQNTSFNFKPKNMDFQKTGFELYFTDQYLLIKNLKIKNDKNIVFMEGKIDNFLNLYYDAPEKMMINWKAHSPYLDIKKMVRTLSYEDKSKSAPKSTRKSDSKSSSNELREVFGKSQASVDLIVDKLAYKNLVGTNFKVNMQLLNGGLYIKNGTMQGENGSAISFDAQLIPKNNVMAFKTNINLSNGVISSFLSSFDNFGVKSFNPKDIKGKLSLKASFSGVLDAERDLIRKSIIGDLEFHVKDGALIKFEPLGEIGKLVFPNRNLENITFKDLYGTTTINKDKVKVNKFRITSNVMNVDAEGVYSLTNTGTNLALRIPLRNPKDDYKMEDAKKREESRYKGIVVNLLVVDGKDGKAKITLGKRPQEK